MEISSKNRDETGNFLGIFLGNFSLHVEANISALRGHSGLGPASMDASHQDEAEDTRGSCLGPVQPPLEAPE